MAVYKVIQDIEAEDKLLGPLTLKGFIYFAIAGTLAFINVRLLIAGGPIYVRLAVIFVLLFPMLLFGVLASPLGRDQPTEVWLLSHVRFMLKPRMRNWDQLGQNNLVTITAPKRPEQILTKGFSQSEVQSRLQALATTLDSHGWVVKNSTVNLTARPGYLDNDSTDDRLIAPASVAQASPVLDVHPSDDILDEQNNATAQKFNEMMHQADGKRREEVMKKMDEVRQGTEPASDSTFLDTATTSGQTVFVGKSVVGPRGDDDDGSAGGGGGAPVSAAEQAIIDKEHARVAEIHRRSAKFHRRGSQPAPKSTAATKPATDKKAPQNTVTAAQAAAKLELAQSGNDLSVASIAHLANRVGQVRQIGPGEVEIKLH